MLYRKLLKKMCFAYIDLPFMALFAHDTWIGVPGSRFSVRFAHETASLASERVEKINQNGLGSDGWDIIASAQRGDKRY